MRRWSFGCLCGCLLIVNATFTLLSPIFPQVHTNRHLLFTLSYIAPQLPAVHMQDKTLRALVFLQCA